MVRGYMPETVQQENDCRMKRMMESHKPKVSKVTEVERELELPWTKIGLKMKV